MKLLVRHQTVYRYDAGASHTAMLLKLMPRAHGGQRVHEWQVSVDGQPLMRFTPNGYGDLEALWTRHDRTDKVTILATGLVETSDTAGVIRGLDERFDPRIYLRETDLTAPSTEIGAMAADCTSSDTLSRLHALSYAIHAQVSYRKGATGPNTTAAEAFAMGAGVCQDHAQIFIAGARSLGIPARYIAGYLLTADEEALHETHGWAEALAPGLGWIGFDPSNKVCVTDHYVRVASGLDAHDAAPVRGSVSAAGNIWIDADVRIAHASDDASERQSQRQQQQQSQS